MMNMEILNHEYIIILTAILRIIASLFVLAVIAGLIAVAIMYFIDKTPNSADYSAKLPCTWSIPLSV